MKIKFEKIKCMIMFSKLKYLKNLNSASEEIHQKDNSGLISYIYFLIHLQPQV